MIDWERYLKHPVFIILAAGAAAASCVFAVLNQWHSQQLDITQQRHQHSLQKLQHEHTTEIDALNARIRGIERRLGGHKHYDISKMFNNKNIRRDSKSLGLSYFADGNFYATTDESKWEVEKIKEYELHEEIVGLAKEDLFSSATIETMGSFNTWLWRGKSEHQVSGSKLIKTIFPYLMVQSIPNDAFGRVFSEAGSGSDNHSEIGDDIYDRETVRNFQMKFGTDTGAAFLVSKLSGITNIAKSEENLRYKIRNMQKRGPIIYLQLVYKIEDIELDGVSKQNLYIVTEWFVVSREDDLLVIEAVAPSMDSSHSEDHFDDHFYWITAFHVGHADF